MPRGRAAHLLAAAVVASAASACLPVPVLDGTSSPAATGTPAGSDPPPAGLVVAPTPVPALGEGEPSLGRRAITVAFTGDVHAEALIGDAIVGGDDPLAAIGPVLAAADLAIVNVETAVGDGGEAADKAYAFRAPTGLWSVLAGAGVDVANLANNHALDHGVEPLPRMLEDARAAGLEVVGAGRDHDAASAPAVIAIAGRRVAVVGLTRVIPDPAWAAAPDRAGLASAYDVQQAADAVRRADALADHVVVTIHWGTEGADCPDEHQLALADALLAAGADVVAGHHPHVLQAIEPRGDALVAFSLGNFLWYAQGPVSRLTGVLTVTLDEAGVAAWELTPAIIGPSGSPEPVTGAEAQEVRDRLAEVSPPAARCDLRS